MTSKFINRFSKFCRKCLDIWATALSADLFIFLTACILLMQMLFYPNFFVLMALFFLFIWAILF